jgi:hypothetical protein
MERMAVLLAATPLWVSWTGAKTTNISAETSSRPTQQTMIMFAFVVLFWASATALSVNGQILPRIR